MWLSTRRYLRYAPDGYLRERATYAVMNGVVTETVDGARTVDALGLAARRRQRMDDAIRALASHPWLVNLHQAERLYDEMAAAHRDYLPERLLA